MNSNQSLNKDEERVLAEDDDCEELCEDESNEENSEQMISQQIFEPNSGQQSVHYQFKTENGQTGAVTYRVVTVADTDTHSAVLTANPALVTSSGHTLGQPSVALLHATSATANPFGGQQQLTSGDGPFYVMMTSTGGQTGEHLMQSGLGGQLGSASKRQHSKEGGGRVARDEKRRATHNEVERRRRDKINNWIIKLSKVVPDCQSDHTKQGQSKGGILAKATEYIQDLCSDNAKMCETMKENEFLNNELDSIRQQLIDCKTENRKMKQLLQKFNIPYNETNSDTNN